MIRSGHQRFACALIRNSIQRDRARHMSAFVSRSTSKKHIELRMPLRPLRNIVLFGAVTVTSVAAIAYLSDEGLARSMHFNLSAFPPLIHYRYVDWKTKYFNYSPEARSAEFTKLHEKYADVPVEVVLKLKGFYCKFAQLLSSLDDSMVPKQYTSKLKVVQDSMPHEPLPVIYSIIENDFGRKVDEIFSEFDPKPLGAASIGQVHKAKLKDGTPVVCKVQYPSAERYFKLDIATTKWFCSIAQPEQLPLFDEIEKQFISEFDYNREAEHLKLINKNMQKFSDVVAVPLPIDKDHKLAKEYNLENGLVSKHVLVMELINGKSLEKTQKEQLEQMAKDLGKTVEQLEEEFKAKLKEEEIQAKKDPGMTHTSPSERMISIFRNALYARDLIRNSFAATYNYSFGLLLGGKPIKYEWTNLPLNAPRMLDIMYKVHGYQLFHDGAFNGDPHPGNIICMDDGRLGLIDYGQVKKLDKNFRVKIARLIIALANDDEDKIVRSCVDLGYRSKHMRPDCIADWARFSFDRITPDVVDRYGGLPVFQENIEKADPLITMPNDLVMAFRLCMLMRINAIGLGYGNSKYGRSAFMMKETAMDFLKSIGESIDPPQLSNDVKLGENYFNENRKRVE